MPRKANPNSEEIYLNVAIRDPQLREDFLTVKKSFKLTHNTDCLRLLISQEAERVRGKKNISDLEERVNHLETRIEDMKTFVRDQLKQYFE